jgi:predicted NBD/HSP70 family sugar kinase
MIITVDTGGTKTLVASFDEEKNPKHIIKFPTPKNVDQYIQRVSKMQYFIHNKKLLM